MLAVFYTIISISLIGLLSYYLIFISLNRNDNASQKHSQTTGISLIICAKNEEENLKRFLPYFFCQEYGLYEIIVVNDKSTDGTAKILDDFAKKESLLHVIHLDYAEKKLQGKRQALWEGIQAAKYPIVALTDADCKPKSNFWLRELSTSFTDNIDIVIAYSPYEFKKGLLNSLIQYETTLTALLYLSFAKIGLPYMGVGRNIAYRKEVITRQIVEASNKTLGGDDDLILAEIATNKNVAVQTSSMSFMETKAPSTFKIWYYQKLRHYSTASHYKGGNMIKAGFFNAFNVLFYTALMGLFFFNAPIFLIIILYLLKIILFIIPNISNLKRLNFSIFFSVWIVDFIYFSLLLTLHTQTLFSKSEWQKAKT